MNARDAFETMTARLHGLSADPDLAHRVDAGDPRRRC